MVSSRCIWKVKEILDQFNIQHTGLRLGIVLIKKELSLFQIKELDHWLNMSGLQLYTPKTDGLVEQIESKLRNLITSSTEPLPINLSVYLSNSLNRPYAYLSNLLLSHTGISIERLYIKLKIERAKELMSVPDMTLTTIAYTLNYSSVAHLSNQFKKVTGMTPTDFRKSS